MVLLYSAICVGTCGMCKKAVKIVTLNTIQDKLCWLVNSTMNFGDFDCHGLLIGININDVAALGIYLIVTHNLYQKNREQLEE